MNKIPQQKRSELTREKIIQAGIKLFSRDGYYSTSSKKIANAAGIAIGSFYNYFEDKKQLLFEIHRRHAQKVHEMIAASLKGLDVTDSSIDGRTLVRGIIEQTLIMHDYSPELHGELNVLSYKDKDFHKIKMRDEKRAIKMLITLLEPQKDALRVDDLEAAAYVLSQSIESTVHSIKILGAPINQKRLTDALGDMVYRYLYKDAD